MTKRLGKNQARVNLQLRNFPREVAHALDQMHSADRLV